MSNWIISPSKDETEKKFETTHHLEYWPNCFSRISPFSRPPTHPSDVNPYRMEEGRDGSGVATEPRSFGVKEFHHRGPDLNKKDAFQLNSDLFFVFIQ